MIVWNRQNKHRFWSPDDRKTILLNAGCNTLVKLLNAISILLNIAVPVLLWYFFGFNLIAFGIVFVVMDIVLNLFEQIFFITIPCLKSKTKSIRVVEKRIAKLIKRRDDIQRKIETFKDENCENCSRNYVWDHYECTRCSAMDEMITKKDKLKDFIEREERYLRQLKNKKQEKSTPEKVDKTVKEKVRNNTKETVVATGNTQKQNSDVLEEIVSALNMYINDYRYDFLIGLRKSLNSVSSVLNSKPNGIIMIPIDYWKKLDILMKALPAVVKMEGDEKTEYLDVIKNVSKEMGDNMQLYISDINKMSNAEGNMNIEELMKRLKEMEENTNA